MLKRLRIKFIAIMMTTVTVLMAVIFGLVLHFTFVNYSDSAHEFMREAAMTGMDKPRPDGRRDHVPVPYFIITESADGKLDIKGSEKYFDLSDEEFLGSVLEQSRANGDKEGLLFGYALRYMSMPAPDNRQQTVFMDATAELSAMEDLVKICLAVGLVSLVLFWGLSMFLARITVKPVERAWEQQRRFVADASHELKTPLTVITTNAELLASPQYSQEDRARFGENILSMALRMRKLVESLLELARADNGSLQLNMEELDLSELYSNSLLPFEPLCFERGLGLESRIEQGIRLRGSREHLSQLLPIFLDNALKYSSSGGRVTVGLVRQGRYGLLTVSSTGEELSPEELKNIFRRFYRSDRARSPDGSYGLGLAIAESIVEAHGGKIWAESRGGLNSFYVRLPI